MADKKKLDPGLGWYARGLRAMECGSWDGTTEDPNLSSSSFPLTRSKISKRRRKIGLKVKINLKNKLQRLELF
jgi:hypothetical protein